MLFFDKFLFTIEKIANCTVKSIGKSVFNREIFALCFGSGENKIIIQSAIHSREFITTHLAIMQAKYLSRKNIDGQIIIIPLANPDGVSLCVDGIKTIDNVEQQKFLTQINGSQDFSLWKANANAVDLNVNFDAKWGKGLKNQFSPASENFVGYAPCDQPETKALCNLVNEEKPKATISYHSKGQEIYYKFGQRGKQLERDLFIAKEISNLTKYPIKNTFFSVGGFKDWCIEKHHIPSLTIEVGSNSLSHPILPISLPNIWEENRLVPEKTLALCNTFDI